MSTRVLERVGAPARPGYAHYTLQRRDPIASNMCSWFDDSRLTPERTAAYLGKLSRLRDKLFQEEDANLSNAIARTLHQGYLPKVGGSGPPGPTHRRKVAVSLDAGPSLHARRQMEKISEIQRRRRGGMRSPPPLTIGVRQLEDPVKPKKGSQKGNESKEEKLDPFDPRVLEPSDPMEKIFNMERIRLMNALEMQKKQALLDAKNGKREKVTTKSTTRQSNLLTPRRGDEWFITGRYKKEERKPKSKIHKGTTTRGKHHAQSKKGGSESGRNSKRDDMSDSKSMDLSSTRSDTRTAERGNIPPSTTPITPNMEQHRVPGQPPFPNASNAVDSTANLMNAIASTAEANKADVRAKTFHYDPNNYRPIGTPKSPRASSGSAMSRYRYDDLRKGKALSNVLQDNNEENLAFVSTSISLRAPYDGTPSYRKGGKGVGGDSDAIKVPSQCTSPSEQPHSAPKSMGDNAKKDPLEIMPKPPGTGQGKTEPLFVPANQAQPLINLRHASPEVAPKPDAEVSLKKIFRQNELREKELNNLFEDIKELNKISDHLRRDGNSGNDIGVKANDNMNCNIEVIDVAGEIEND